MASWRFVVTDLNFVPQGEVINASERRVSLPLNKLPSASLITRLDNPLAERLLTTECYLKGYRTTLGLGEQLRFFGPVISAEESGDQDKATVSVNAVGVGWIMAKLLQGIGGVSGAQFYALDRGSMMGQIFFTQSTVTETHIDATTGPFTSGSVEDYTVPAFASIQDSLTDLSATFNGFDWQIVPLENWTPGGTPSTKIGRFEIYPVIGSTRPNSLFEWGIGRCNISSYKRTIDRSTQANRVFHTTGAGANSTNLVVHADDATSQAKWGVIEDVAQSAIVDTSLRQALVDEHVRVRKDPRELITFVPHLDPNDTGRLPLFGYEYDVGDTVVARAAYNGVTRFNVNTRVWGVDFAINDLGLEQQTLTLVSQ